MLKQVKIASLLFTSTLFILIACQSKQNKQPKLLTADFNWLCGNWINNQDSTALYFENWIENESGNFEGTSYVIAKQDTVFFEKIQLFTSDTGIYYAVSVRNQNDANAIHFKLISCSNNIYSFENKKHDFPQQINYQFKAPDTLNAWIEGIVDGKTKKESFLMWRAKK